jgi:DNA-3-methyladenine glycosylase I
MENSCNWATRNKLMEQYHDEEWGVPLHDDQKLFEFLVLEGFQAGLSWQTVLNKREAFREAFEGFIPEKVAIYQEADVDRLMNNSLIIRNKQKIEATISNARYFLEIQKEFGSFDHYIWGFLNFKPVINEFSTLSQLPATSELSDIISKDLRMRGFKFVGSTIVYAHMQATGMVNDHLVSCSRYHEIIMMNK